MIALLPGLVTAAYAAGGGAPLAAPQVRAVAFADADDTANCDPVEARYGRCIEEAVFAERSMLFPADQPATHALLRNTSDLYASTLEDFTYRWAQKEDVLTATLQASGFLALPEPARTWDAAQVGDGLRYALPETAAWLPAAVWTTELAPGVQLAPGQIFRQVRQRAQPGDDASAPLVLLAGRFALRLGFDGRPHDYDLMDAHPASSGPFLEQLYPSDKRGASSELGALSRFAGSKGNDTRPVIGSGGYADVSALAHREFDLFSRMVTAKIARFALQDYTENQIRVFAAITGMREPPARGGSGNGRTRDLVAAAIYQTDTDAAIESRTNERVFAIAGGVRLRYEYLPQEVVLDWLDTLQRREGSSPALVARIEAALREYLGDNAVRSAPLVDYTEEDLSKWLVRTLLPGMDPNPVQIHVQRIALKTLVSAGTDGADAAQLRREQAQRDQDETWLLIDHAHHAMVQNLDDTSGKRVPPADVATMATSEWKNTLSLHGYRASPLQQGLGAVDPTAICTTRDGRDALAEPVFGAVDLDLLVSAPAGLTDAADVLWESEHPLPFVGIDDMLVTKPALDVLVGLPRNEQGPRSLYRVRWKVWTGWHLAWGVEEGADGASVLQARTTAICDDTVLAPPALVPTLARAALLEGEYRPTTPILSADLEGRGDVGKQEREALTADDALAGAQSGGTAAAAGVTDATDTVAALKADGVTAENLQSASAAASELFKQSSNATEEVVSPNVAYVRRLIRTPLLALAGQLGGTVLFITDSRRTKGALADALPRTPYTRVQRPAGDGTALRTASWTFFLPSESKAPVYVISPAYRPTESVATTAAMPRWRRNGSVDWTFGAGLGVFPWRSTAWTCSVDDQDLDVVAPCDAGDPVVANGESLDLRAMAAMWLFDRPRLAFEVGPAFRLDAVHAGASIAPGADASLLHAWTFRPQGGVIFGLRTAPAPAGLWARSGWPWAAERPDGTSRLGRLQAGFRAGMLFGPGFNGVEANVLGEIWSGVSVRAKRGPQASLTPYHPSTLIGPYAQLGYGFLPDAEATGYRVLDTSWTVTFGVTAQVRLAGAPPALPEAPK